MSGLLRLMGGETKAFILGAGLGTRLRPLTDGLPKPLVPVVNRPLVTYAMDHLIEEVAVSEFMVNTHHCPEVWPRAFPTGRYRGRAVSFRHEPVLLDTAGGLDNVRDWLPQGEPFLVYNGDILTDLPLAAAWRHHLDAENLVTLVLRSDGGELRVGFDADSGRVVDLRGALRPDWTERYQFTGIYLVSPGFLCYLVPGKIESVVLALLRAIEAGEKIGGTVVDEGMWSDLGERSAYLGALEEVCQFRRPLGPRVSPEARIAAGAVIDEFSTVGGGAEIGANAVVSKSVVWSGGCVEAGATLSGVVVRSGGRAVGNLKDVDL